MPEWSFSYEKIYALLPMDSLLVIEQPPPIGPAVSARRYELGKTTEKRRKKGCWSTAVRNARAYMPRNLKSLYGGHKLITCLTSPATVDCADILPSQNHFYSVFSSAIPSFSLSRSFFSFSGSISLFYVSLSLTAGSRSDRFSVTIERF